MNDYLLLAVGCLGVALCVLVLGQMRVIGNSVYIPLLVSSFIFIGLYSITIYRAWLIPLLNFKENLNRVLFYDYGNGLIGLLPLALAVLLLGKYLLKINYQEQWSGTTCFTSAALQYGSVVGLLLAAIPLLMVASKGQKLTYTIDGYRYMINCATNLYEEILCRGLLLACCVKYWTRIAGVIWTSVVFGLAHGLTGNSIAIASAAGLMAWAVLKAKSLWAGWTSHQVTDMLVDTFLP